MHELITISFTVLLRSLRKSSTILFVSCFTNSELRSLFGDVKLHFLDCAHEQAVCSLECRAQVQWERMKNSTCGTLKLREKTL